ncbi:unnamed protein product [Trifolium pratense]|uniref:Uncharacterized protein n=1 Tax=Trifolium pratense TaxID=57577 RepID=A0ACB0KL03_TRIPR|nr:unnamed protein product [Trifolium pratense]
MDNEGERERVDVGVSEESVKNFEGEEVFEEAMDPIKRFDDLGGDAVVGEDDVVTDTVSELPSDLVDEVADKKEESDTFRESVGVDDEEELEVIANQEVREDQQGQLYNKEAEGGVSCDESYSIKDDFSGGKELSDSNADGSVVFQEGRDLVNGESGLLSEKGEGEDLEYVTPRQNGGLISENGSTDKVDFAVEEFRTESGSDEEMKNKDADGGYLKEDGLDPDLRDDKIEEERNDSGDPSSEIQDGTDDLEHHHEIFVEMEDETIGTDAIHKDTNGKETGVSDSQSTESKVYSNHETKDDDAESNSEHLETIGETGGSSPAVNESEVVETAGSSSLSENSLANEMPTVQATAADSEVGSTKVYQSQISTEENQGNYENLSVVDRSEVIETGGSSPTLDERKVTETVVNSSISENSSANEIPTVQTTAADSEEGSAKVYQSQISNEENQGNSEISSVVDRSEVIETLRSSPALDEVKVAETVGSSPPSENSFANELPTVQATAADSVKETSKVYPSKISNAENQGNYEKSSVVGEPEKIPENNTKEKQTTQIIKEQNSELDSSSGKSVAPGTPLDRPVGLGPVAPLLRPTPRVVQQPRVNNTKEKQTTQITKEHNSELDSSSGKSVPTSTPLVRPAGLGSAAPLLEPSPRVVQQPRVNNTVSNVQSPKMEDSSTGEAEEYDETREKLQMIRVKFLRLAKRFGQTPHNVVVAQVLYRLGLAEQLRGRNGGRVGAFSFDRASAMAEQLESAGQEPLDFSCTIMVLGKTGVGKSSTINSIFDEQAIRQAAGDMRLMNPVSLVENHSACRTNTAGQRVLPNDQVWKPHLLLLSFASKILAEANALLKLQDNPREKPYTARARAPPLPFLLSSLLQSRPQLKLPEEQFSDDDGLNDDLDEPSDSGDETDPDDLPPFKPLTKAQIKNLSRAQKKAYLDEVEYREKLFMKKQLKYEKKQRKMMKEMAESAKDLPTEYGENVEEESEGASSVPVPMPDMSLPASFDSDTPTHRYRYLDSSNQWLVRPVLETHGWDHDVGYEGLNVERLFVLKDKIPVSFSGQVTKDKKDANVQMEMASSVKHGEGKATSLGFDMQTVGKDLAYTLRSETKFLNFRRNKGTAGLSFTLLGDALSAGVKVEDKLIANKRFKLVIAGGAMTGRDDVAYGGSLEAQLRDKNYPLGRSLSTLGLSVMDWHGDLAVGCNLQSQIPIGRYTNLVARANLNNRGAGQISIRLNSSEQLQIALIGLIPLLQKVVGYSQQLQYGQ